MSFFRGLKISLLLPLVLISCSSVNDKVDPTAELFKALVKDAKSQQPKNLQAGFEKVCQEKNLAACYVLGRSIPPNVLKRLPILQGVTDSRSTQLVIMHPTKSSPEFLLFDRETLRVVPPRDFQRRAFSGADKAVTWIRYRGLQKGRDYALEVLSPSGKLVDARVLRALDTQKKDVTFAVASCMDDSFVGPQKVMWTELLSQKPDLLFLLGDNVYADRAAGGVPKVADPAQLWRRYSETRDLLELFKTEMLVPTVATWDDHDYGSNDGDRTYLFKSQSRDVFLRFFPQEVVADFFSQGPGVASHFHAFGQQFFLMDGRSFRSGPKENLDKSHWGEQQEKWLFDTLKASNSPAWIFSGDQFFGGYHKFESFEGNHPESFKKFVEGIKTVKAPVVLVSGDRHLAELMQVSDFGYPTYELTTSAIHAKTFEDHWKEMPNARKIEGVAGSHNYMVVKSRAQDGQLAFKVTAYGPKKKVLFERDLQVSKVARAISSEEESHLPSSKPSDRVGSTLRLGSGKQL